MDGSGARRLGERLVGGVEGEGLSELFASLRDLALPQTEQRSVFGIPELDALLPSPQPPQQPQPQHQHSDDNNDHWTPDRHGHQNNPQPVPPAPQKKPTKPQTHILELISPPYANHPSQAGKTSLTYHLTTLSILPSTLSTIPLHGKNGAVILFDPLSHFSTTRLAQHMLHHIISCFRTSNRSIDDAAKKDVLQCVQRCLIHVHIFRPVSWSALLETLRRMPSYLFDETQHRSIQRHIQLLVLEDVDVFVPGIRAAASSSTLAGSGSSSINPLATPSAQLTNLLSNLASRFSAQIILTSRSASTSPSSFRSSIPLSWPLGTAVTRLAVRRVEVVKFAPGTSVEEAEAERGQRWEVVSRNRFECWKVGGGGNVGEGFVFRVRVGVEVERGEG